jgi:hypothetical protein
MPSLAWPAPAAKAWSQGAWLPSAVTALRFAPMTGIWNIAGYPAMSIPAGLVAGMPGSVQLVSTPGKESVLLSLAAEIERAAPWPRHAPGYDPGDLTIARHFLGQAVSGGRHGPVKCMQLKFLSERPRMAAKTVVTLEDDLDGGAADETLRFGLGAAEYEIDLSAANADRFRAQLAPFLARARKVTRSPRAQTARSAAGRRDSAQVRSWAREHGLEISERGRIPASVIEQYDAAAH